MRMRDFLMLAWFIASAGATRAASAQTTCAARGPVMSAAIVTDTDRFAGTVSYCAGPFVEADGLQFTWFWLRPTRTTRTSVELTPVSLEIMSTSQDWQYLYSHNLDLLLNGTQRVAIGAMDHDGTVGDGYVLEQMSTVLPEGRVAQLATAKKVEFRLGLTEGTLSDPDIIAIRRIVVAIHADSGCMGLSASLLPILSVWIPC